MTELEQLREQATRLQQECNRLLEDRRSLQWQQMVESFHEKYGATVGETPGLRDVELRAKLVREEAQEFLDALEAGSLIDAVDAIADLIYVSLGSAVTFGVDMVPVFAEVQRSNMTKDGSLREDGKILKGDAWEPPRIAEILEGQR